MAYFFDNIGATNMELHRQTPNSTNQRCGLFYILEEEAAFPNVISSADALECSLQKPQ